MISNKSLSMSRRTACMLTLLAASPCFASLQPVGQALAAMKYTSSCRVHADLSEDCTNTRHYDILTAAGRDSLSQVSLSASDNQTVSGIEAYVIKRDGTRTLLPDSQIVKKSGTGPDQGIDNSTNTILLFQGLEVGGSIEYRTKEHSKATKDVSAFHQLLRLMPLPLRVDGYHIEYIADKPIIWRSEEPDVFDVKPSDGGKKITVDLAKPYYLATVNEDDFTVRKLPRIELAFSDKLDEHYGKLVGIYNKILSTPLPPQAAKEVERLKQQPQKEQIQSLIKFLATHYRYLADYRLDSRGRIPLDLARIEKNGYGDCKDLTTLLTAMIRGLGIDAEPAFVVRGDYAPTLLIPGLGAPNHAIVRATVDGNTWWIDATNPVLLPGYTPQDLQDRWAIVVGKDGRPRLDSIPSAEAALAEDTTQDTRFHPDGTSDTDSSTLLNGARLLSLLQLEHDEGVNATNNALCADDKECSVTRPATDRIKPPYLVKVHSPGQPAPAKHEGKYAGSLGDYFKFNLEALKNYRRTGGVGDLNLGVPMTRQMSMKISGAKLSRPMKNCHVQSRWFDYDAEARQEPNGVTVYQLRSVEKVAWIAHAELVSDEFGKFLSQAEDCFEGLTYSYTTDAVEPRTGK
ncbi:transglutaminase domain-containing protein [Dyella sp. 2RAB6]|uniref:transglutaminase domain-containing protein n=1 Tax=Dyella sp. 2RAB6 TaxID=3232992 RepID=UPI003F9325B1